MCIYVIVLIRMYHIIIYFVLQIMSQAAWTLKTRALTEQVYVDEVDVDEEGLAELLMDDNSIAQVARPGTSLKVPTTGKGAPSQGVR